MNILILHLTYAEKYIHNIHHSTDLKKTTTHKRKVFIAMKRSMNDNFLGVLIDLFL